MKKKKEKKIADLELKEPNEDDELIFRKILVKSAKNALRHH